MPDGPTPQAPSTAGEGDELFVASEMRGDLRARSIFGLTFPEEAPGMDIAALYLVRGALPGSLELH
jgi:hypothetical protein